MVLDFVGGEAFVSKIVGAAFAIVFQVFDDGGRHALTGRKEVFIALKLGNQHDGPTEWLISSCKKCSVSSAIILSVA